MTCFVESHPEALTFWEFGGRMLQPGSRFAISTINGQLSYKIEMKLVITGLRGNDFGLYKCIAKNPRGTTDGSITLTGA